MDKLALLYERMKKLRESGVKMKELDENRILWCCTEMNSKADIDKAVAVVKEV